jgi:chromate transport protein ChrA
VLLDGSEVVSVYFRAYAHSGGQYGLVELLLVSLLGTNQELASFFPGLYRPLAFPLPTANIYALGYLLPGLHLKTFFLLVAGEGWAFVTLAYLAVHLPSLLLACVGLTQREAFLSLEWRKMSESVQAASNGLVLVAVGSMLAEEDCQLHIAFFTALVIFTVTKLYKFNEIISALLGVFLVASRAAVLHLNNKKPLSDFLCRQK